MGSGCDEDNSQAVEKCLKENQILKVVVLLAFILGQVKEFSEAQLDGNLRYL